jgi:hypothetical protein
MYTVSWNEYTIFISGIKATFSFKYNYIKLFFTVKFYATENPVTRTKNVQYMCLSYIFKGGGSTANA